jgi:hypothetical protein
MAAANMLDQEQRFCCEVSLQRPLCRRRVEASLEPLD